MHKTILLLLVLTGLSALYGETAETLLPTVDSAYAVAMRGDIRQAIAINEDGLQRTPHDSTGIRCEFYSCLLYCYHRLGDYERALHYGEMCLAYDETQEDQSNLSASLGNLAGIYSSAGRHDVAITYLRRAIAIEEELLRTDTAHTPRSLAIRKAMLGEVLLAKAKAEGQKELLAEAMTLTREALLIDKEAGRLVQVGMRLSQLGNICLALGDAEQARRCNTEALRIARETGNRMTEVITLLQLGENCEAAALAAELGLKKQEEEACRALAAQASGQGNYKEAYIRLQRASELREMIQTEQSERQLTIWQVRYDTRQKEAEIDAQARRLQQKQIQQRWLTALVCLSLLALALAVFAAWLSARRKHDIEETARQKDRHYTILSHDLKNPMVAQQQVLRILYRDYDSYTPQEIRQQIGRLSAGSDSSLELLHNLQEVALLEIGKREVKPVRMDLNGLLRETVESMQSVAALKHVSFDVRSERMPVVADRDTLRTVIRNLLSNAVKFSYENTTVETGTIAPDKFYVKDCGTGMSRERVNELLTTRSVVVSDKGTKGESGTGIGLLICRELLRLNHAEMEIESEAGKGTTFVITLPQSE